MDAWLWLETIPVGSRWDGGSSCDSTSRHDNHIGLPTYKSLFPAWLLKTFESVAEALHLSQASRTSFMIPPPWLSTCSLNVWLYIEADRCFPRGDSNCSHSCYLTAPRSFWGERMTARPSDKQANSGTWHNYTLLKGRDLVNLTGWSQADMSHLFCKVLSRSSNSWLTEAEEERLNVRLLRWSRWQLSSSLAEGVKSRIKSDRGGARGKEKPVTAREREVGGGVGMRGFWLG